MAAGTTAKILHVDLSTRETRAEILPETTVRKYLGGGALASYFLLRDMPAGVDPLGPDNVLVFTTSVINGLSLSGATRWARWGSPSRSPSTARRCARSSRRRRSEARTTRSACATSWARRSTRWGCSP